MYQPNRTAAITIVDQKGLTVELVQREPGSTGRQAVVVIYVIGELDLSNSELLSRGLDDCIQKGQVRIVLNLAGLRYLDSSGIGVLIKNIKAVISRGGDMKFSCVPEPVMNILKYVRLDKLVSIHTSEQKAVEAFA